MNKIDNLISFCEKNNLCFLKNEPMKNHSTFKIGGNASCVVFPKSSFEIQTIYKYLNENDIKNIVLGNGSNVLISDKEFNGCAIILGSHISDIKLISDMEIYAQSGAALSAVCLFALEHNLTGLEFAYGIPGTVGGAVRMNAGAYGGEIKDVFTLCRYISKNGENLEAKLDDADFSYRHSMFTNNKAIITEAVFSLKKGHHNEIESRMKELMQKRKNNQPLEYANAGSTFKRPEGAFAGQLIEQCGLKGFHIGDAYVSEKHAGFVINKGNADFDDVLSLIKHIQTTVKKETGFNLETEIEII